MSLAQCCKCFCRTFLGLAKLFGKLCIRRFKSLICRCSIVHLVACRTQVRHCSGSKLTEISLRPLQLG